MLELEHYHFVAFIENPGLSKKSWWMLKLGKCFYTKEDIWMALECLPQKCLVVEREKQ